MAVKRPSPLLCLSNYNGKNRLTMNKQILFSVLTTLLISQNLQAQGCCGVGSSLVAGGHPAIEMGSILVQPSVDYSSAENPMRRKGSAALNVAYGITDRLSASVKTHFDYLYSSRLQPAVVYRDSILYPEKTVVQQNVGIGDGNVGVQFSIIPMEVLTQRELTIGADVGIPWGPDRKKTDGVELPNYLQTGSGSTTVGGFVSYTKGFALSRLGFSATAAGRLKFENRRGEDPGDELGLLGTAMVGPFSSIRGSLSVNYKFTGSAQGAGNVQQKFASGTRVDLIPTLEFSLSEKVKLSGDVEIPVYRDVNQKQYGNTLGARFMMLFFLPVLSAHNE